MSALSSTAVQPLTEDTGVSLDMQTKYRLAVILIALGISGGCAVSVIDAGGSQAGLELIGQCYALKLDSFVFESSCAEVDAKLQSFGKCNSIQAFGVDSRRGKLPSSYQDYKENKDKWDRIIFKSKPFHRINKRIFPLKAGTRFSISRLINFPMGESGRIWIIRADIIGGDLQSAGVELPSHAIHLLPYWVSPTWITNVDELPRIDNRFAERVSCGIRHK